MNNIAMTRALQRRVQPKFRGNKNILPRTTYSYPHNLEREYTRIIRAYMGLLSQSLSEYLPIIRQAMAKTRAQMRHDDYDEFGEILYGINDVIMDVFGQVHRDFERRARAFNLEGRIATLADQTRNISVTQWRRLVFDTLGVNILEDYYRGEFFRHAVTAWVNRNVGLIKSVPQETISNLRNVVQDGWRQGLLNNDISRRIEAEYRVKTRKAQFWARDQMAKLNADITQQQQKDAGVEEYVWSTSRDERVRGNPNGKWANTSGNHYALEGKRYSWSNPPVVDIKTGRTAHPGEDYRCRCVALPVFNLPGLSLPWEKGENL